MPKLSANLGMLFAEAPFLDRFERAAKAGFTGVEYPSGYDWPARTLADRLARNGLDQVLLNMPAGEREAGERGLAALPGREGEFRDSVGTALDYAKALSCPRLHAMAGIVTDEARRGEMEETYIENLKTAAGACASLSVKLLIEPINRLREAGVGFRFLQQQMAAGSSLSTCFRSPSFSAPKWRRV
ncbi:MAG: TIM barrel protein [Alphaproteobacteria bacterium]|nr:TIM barrel protein [Alphaproteobacteria bacterium]